MPPTQRGDQLKDLVHQQRDMHSSHIEHQLLGTLGKPRDLLAVQVRRLWEHYYRVNILVGMDVTSVKIANSYFVRADNDGNIVESTPKIKKQY